MADRFPTIRTTAKPALRLAGTQVSTTYLPEAKPDNHIRPADFAAAVNRGWCTHENVREVVHGALGIDGIRAQVSTYFARTIRSLLVDEVYDANDLDVEIIRIAAEAGLAVTLVGDPWQALYAFRGARPESVRRLIEALGFERGELRTSFRWRDSSDQASLARLLRRGERVLLPTGAARDVDVVLARRWKTLWNGDAHVLPLAVKQPSGPFQEAVCTLLLNELTQSSFGLPAAFLADARTTLGIEEAETFEELRPDLQSALQGLASQDDLGDIWTALADSVLTKTHIEPSESQRRTPRKALGNLRMRLQNAHERLVPGLTCHQAKGREWDRVGMRLEESDAAVLRKGLDPADEAHRSLYVALTRARVHSLAV